MRMKIKIEIIIQRKTKEIQIKKQINDRKNDLSQEYFLWYFQQVRILAAHPNLLGIYIESS